MKIRVTLTIIVLMIATQSSLAADWPQWQGPERNAVSKETGLLKEWPKNGPPLAWRIKGLGGGYSAPSIAAERIFGMSNRGSDEVVWCLSEADGKELWATRLGPAQTEGMPQGKEGPGCTPTVDGDRLYVLGLGGNLACLQAQDGKIIWRHSLKDDFGGRIPMWRYNESPLVDGNKVICTPGGEKTTLFALDKLTGETIWKSHVPDSPDGGNQADASPGRGRGAPGDRSSSPPPGGTQRGASGGRPRGFPSAMQVDPVLKAIDADGNKEISPHELDGSPAALGKLDKNKDGKLTEDEVTPVFGNRGRAGGQSGSQSQSQSLPSSGRGGRRGMRGIMRFMPANKTLDADNSGEIDAAEIKNAAAALRKLDKNVDGKLTEDEVSPRFGGGRRGPASGAAYSSAIAIDFDGQRQYVQLLARTLVGVAASDGKVLWRYDRAANRMGINCSTPIYQDGLVFAASAYGAGGGALKLSKDADNAVKAEEVYFTTRMQNHHGGMIVFDGCLYGANGGNSGGFLSCLDFQTGKVLWRDRKAPKGSMALADERLVYRTEDGTMLLIEPNREKYIERGRFDQSDRSKSPAWTHPVIANGKLYVRDQDLLLCYDVKAK